MSLMEKRGFDLIEGRLYLCAECFSTYSKLILTHPREVEYFGMPSIPKIMPIEEGKITPCEKCKFEIALGHVSYLLEPKRVESRERE